MYFLPTYLKPICLLEPVEPVSQRWFPSLWNLDGHFHSILFPFPWPHLRLGGAESPFIRWALPPRNMSSMHHRGAGFHSCSMRRLCSIVQRPAACRVGFCLSQPVTFGRRFRATSTKPTGWRHCPSQADWNDRTAWPRSSVDRIRNKPVAHFTEGGWGK